MPKYVRFEWEGGTHYGLLRDESHVERFDDAPWDGGQPTGEVVGLRAVRVLAPCRPSKIICLGRTYREHAAELGNEPPGEPLYFLKPPSAVIGPEESIILPAQSQRVDYEGELALVVGRRCPASCPHGRRWSREELRGCLFGVTCLNDVTARDLQRGPAPFTRSKGFDTFCPVGPAIATDLDLGNLMVETHVNGERRQRGSTAEWIFSLDGIMESVVSVMTLEPGDLIATGTPPGVGQLRAGDVVEVSVEGIGRLRNRVAAAIR